MTGPIRVDSEFLAGCRGADKLATESVINLLRTESLVSAALNTRFRPYGLSVATFNVLMILDGADGPLCPHEIGDRLLVTRGTVTGLLDSLERRGLVMRRMHPDDRRMVEVSLTPKARKLLSELLPEHFPGEADLVSALSAREKETLIRLLGKIQRHLA